MMRKLKSAERKKRSQKLFVWQLCLKIMVKFKNFIFLFNLNLSLTKGSSASNSTVLILNQAKRSNPALKLVIKGNENYSLNNARFSFGKQFSIYKGNLYRRCKNEH